MILHTNRMVARDEWCKSISVSLEDIDTVVLLSDLLADGRGRFPNFA
jgi:hypothetical protein